MGRARMQAVCGSCRWRSVCPDAATLEQMARAIEGSRLAGEFPMRVARRYRLGCDRYRYAGKEPVGLPTTQLRLVVANDGEPPGA
jgi:hypothetical protein